MLSPRRSGNNRSHTETGNRSLPRADLPAVRGRGRLPVRVLARGNQAHGKLIRRSGQDLISYEHFGYKDWSARDFNDSAVFGALAAPRLGLCPNLMRPADRPDSEKRR